MKAVRSASLGSPPRTDQSLIRKALDATGLYPIRKHDAGVNPFYSLIDPMNQHRLQITDVLHEITSHEAHGEGTDAVLGDLAMWLVGACDAGSAASHSLMMQRLLTTVGDLLQQTIALGSGASLEPLNHLWPLNSAGADAQTQATIPFVLFIAAIVSMAGRSPLPPLPKLIRGLIRLHDVPIRGAS